MDSLLTTAARGRPREFCVQSALAAALGVFWSKGYEAASMTELTLAMGITKPSLYAAFGNKEQLFRKALDLYEAEKLAYIRSALEQPTARAVAESLMRGAVEAQTSSCDPKGCLGVIGASACGAEAQSIKAEILKRRGSSAAALIERFRKARDEGDFPVDIEPESLAQLLFTMIQGMAVQAVGGATREELDRVIDTGLRFWPGR